MHGSAGAGNAIPPQSARKKTATLSPAQLLVRRFTSFSLPNPRNLEMGCDHNIPLCGGVIFVVCPPANERMGVTGGEPPSIYGPWFQPFSDSIASGWGRRTGVKTNLHLHAFRLVAGCKQQPHAFGSRDAQDPPLDYASRAVGQGDFFTATRRYPRGTSWGTGFGPRPHHLPPVTHRVSHDHHPQFPGTQVKEARRIADLENQRDSLRSQLKETEANLLATQKNADLVKSQRDELRTRLNESRGKKANCPKKCGAPGERA